MHAKLFELDLQFFSNGEKIKALEVQIENLKLNQAELELDLETSAQVGTFLMQENSQLKQKIEELQAEIDQQVEELKKKSIYQTSADLEQTKQNPFAKEVILKNTSKSFEEKKKEILVNYP